MSEINLKKNVMKLKVQLPHKTTVEQVYLKRLNEQQAFIPKEDFKNRHSSLNKIMTINIAQQNTQPSYYSHINEIRSIKEFLYVSEKLKQKNIERKMTERLELKGKLNKIKEIEIGKKMQYYLEKKIRLFLKETQHEEQAENKNFDAFYENIRTDVRIMSFPDQTLREEFIKIQSQTSFHQERPKSQKPTYKSQKEILPVPTEQSDTFNDNKEDGTSKFLTMKVANQLLGLMMIESSKGKRIPILWAANKKKELEGILNKPFGGKMHFDPQTFNWLIENTLSKSQSMLKRRGSTGTNNQADPPFKNDQIQNQIKIGLKSIAKTLRFRPVSAINLDQRKNLKNRRVVNTEYQVSDRIKQNVQSQAYRNQKVHDQHSKGVPEFFQNDSYVSHYI